MNKKCVVHRCRHHNQRVTWSFAQDTPRHAEFQTRPYLQLNKEKWIPYHDKHCEKVYAIIQLALGLPVMLVDHLDRSPDKQLLRGKEGHVHGWEHDPDEKKSKWCQFRHQAFKPCPLCVFIDFHTEAWSIPGALGPGIYPAFQTETTWYLDGYRG